MRNMMQTPSLSRLRQTYLDPSMNLIFGHMKDSQKDYEEIILDMNAMSNTLLHIRNQLNDSHRQINLLYESNNNSNPLNAININHTDRSDGSLKQKRIHSSNRTTSNIDVDSIPLNSTNNDYNQHSISSTSRENGIITIS